MCWLQKGDFVADARTTKPRVTVGLRPPGGTSSSAEETGKGKKQEACEPELEQNIRTRIDKKSGSTGGCMVER